MYLASSGDSLFGRITGIQGEHKDLGVSLRLVRQMCAALEAGQSTTLTGELEPVRLLGGLRNDLFAHFEAEEDDGYFGTLAREQPGLQPTIAELTAEHATMRALVERLCSLAGDETRWAELAKPALQLVSILFAHEHRETGLMQGFLSPPDEGEAS